MSQTVCRPARAAAGGAPTAAGRPAVGLRGARRPPRSSSSRPRTATCRRLDRTGSCRRSTCSRSCRDPAGHGDPGQPRSTTSGSSRTSSTASASRPPVVDDEHRPGRHPVRGPARERHVKLSRIEGLADDLAMALAARTIRIEAPIPGKDVVGIEIPNVKSARSSASGDLVDDSKMLDADEPALVRPRARRVGQGLCGRPGQDAPPARGRGDRLGQERLHQRPHHEHPHARHARRGAAHPHRPQAGRARPVRRPAAPAPAGHRRDRATRRRPSTGAVRQMEERYKALAAKSVRNIAAFNASDRRGARGDACPTSSSSSTSWPTSSCARAGRSRSRSSRSPRRPAPWASTSSSRRSARR